MSWACKHKQREKFVGRRRERGGARKRGRWGGGGAAEVGGKFSC